ncbi:intracellular serine protease [Fusarium longipes]|uniref:Intracellular serine protease n=1 Tax=Fusarium longipes TaxID=694270 RepID=A0A395SNU7_9HYPO|nr:intracellular serine protease [Fusarium longipes]
MSYYEEIEDESLDDVNGIEGLIFPMIETGSEASKFRIRNNPIDPFHRAQVIQRTGHGVQITCNLIDVVHGAISADSNYWATILVFQFRFDPEKKTRRISEATIELVFDTMEAKGSIPEVDSLSFNGHHSYSPSMQSVTHVKGGEGSIGASFAATASASYKWEKSVGREVAYAATISGNKLMVDDIGPLRKAKWILLENDDQKKGVPGSVQVAVRVKRLDEAVFSCHVNLTCKADIKTAMRDFFGGLPKDDPVLLNPKKGPTNRLLKYDVEELGAVDLETLRDATTTTMLQGV